MAKVDYDTTELIKDIMPSLINYESFVTYLERNAIVQKLQMIKK